MSSYHDLVAANEQLRERVKTLEESADHWRLIAERMLDQCREHENQVEGLEIDLSFSKNVNLIAMVTMILMGAVVIWTGIG